MVQLHSGYVALDLANGGHLDERRGNHDRGGSGEGWVSPIAVLLFKVSDAQTTHVSTTRKYRSYQEHVSISTKNLLKN